MPPSDALATCSLLQRMTAAEREALADISALERHEDGVYIFNAGDPAKSLYVLERGTVEAVRKGGNVVGTLTAGSMFGEGPFFTEGGYLLGARASGGAQVLRFDYEALRALFARRPEVALAFYRSACSEVHARLRQLGDD